jgi:hypothetical protein
MAVKKMPAAGRASKASGKKAAPVKKGMTSGTARNRAKLDVPWNPLGAVNGSVPGASTPGKAAKKRGKGK